MLSVIVPVYNRENLIEECLTSILNQTYEEFEIIVVNDGSTDGTADVVKRMKRADARIRLIEKVNGGVSSARNRGLSYATGQYVMFIDSDDTIPEDYFEKLISAWEENNEEALILADSPEEAALNQGKGIEVFDRNGFFQVYFMYLLNPPWNKLYKRSLIKEQELCFDESVSIGEDLIFNLCYIRILNPKKFIILHDTVYGYNQEGMDSLMKKYHANYYAVHQRIFEEIKKTAEIMEADDRERLLNEIRWEHFIGTFQNELKKGNAKSLWKRFFYNSNIMKSNEYKETFEKRKSKMNPIYYPAYRSGNYAFMVVWVWCAGKCWDIKHRCWLVKCWLYETLVRYGIIDRKDDYKL